MVDINMNIEAVIFSAEKNLLIVYGNKDRLKIQVDLHPVLKQYPAEYLSVFEIDSDGSFVYWPKADIHMGWEQFLQFTDPEVLQKAKEKASEFNKRYGAAIRKVRTEYGVLEAKIEGLEESKLSSIESGEHRATSSALKALAKAHNLEPNAYLDVLAKAIEK
jgi:hypothetical protein